MACYLRLITLLVYLWVGQLVILSPCILCTYILYVQLEQVSTQTLVLIYSSTMEKWVEGKSNKVFSPFSAKFLPYLMIFQSRAHRRCWQTLTNHQLQQNIGKKWRKVLFNLPSIYFWCPKIGFWIPVPPLFVLWRDIFCRIVDDRTEPDYRTYRTGSRTNLSPFLFLTFKSS